MNNLWEYMKNNGLKIDLEFVPKLLKCSICESVLIDAMYTKCGCSFCKICIDDYFAQLKNDCPGCLKNAINNSLIYYEDLFEDIKSRISVSKLKVKCPNVNCVEYFELYVLLDHLKICDKSKVSCLFERVGCTASNKSAAELEKHIVAGRNEHFDLLINKIISLQTDIESVNSLQLDIDNVRNYVNNIVIENTDLTTEIANFNIHKDADCAEFARLNNELNKLKVEIVQVNCNSAADKTEIGQLKNELNQLNSLRNSDKSEIVNLKKEMVKIRDNLVKIMIVLKTIINFCEEQHDYASEGDNIAFETIEVSIDDTKLTFTGNEAASSPLSVSTNQFEWRISMLRDLGESRERFSNIFMIEDYSMCLGLVLSQRWGGVTIHLYLAGSSYSKEPSWPMKLSITVSVEDLTTEVVIKSSSFSHQSSQYQSDYCRPTKERVQIHDSRVLFHPDTHSEVANINSVLVKVSANN